MSNSESRIAVTGAASGIGLAVAELLEALGYEVIRLDLTGGAQVIPFDVTDESCWNSLSHGGVRGLVHAAGIRGRSPIKETSLQDFKKVMDVNVCGTFLALRWASRRPDVERDAQLSVVALSSAVIHRGVERQLSYNASKAAVAAMVQSAARELAPLAVRVNAIAPGSIRTPMTEEGWAEDGHAARMRAEIPLGRPGSASEIADVAAFLISDASSYVTGSILVADGGWTS